MIPDGEDGVRKNNLRGGEIGLNAQDNKSEEYDAHETAGKSVHHGVPFDISQYSVDVENAGGAAVEIMRVCRCYCQYIAKAPAGQAKFCGYSVKNGMMRSKAEGKDGQRGRVLHNAPRVAQNAGRVSIEKEGFHCNAGRSGQFPIRVSCNPLRVAGNAPPHCRESAFCGNISGCAGWIVVVAAPPEIRNVCCAVAFL